MADRSEGTTGDRPPVVERTVPPGSDDRAEAVWTLKERIRRLEGLLRQRRPFFDAQYRRSTAYLAEPVAATVAGDAVDPASGTDGASGDSLAGFALARPDGYLSLLGVAPAHRRRGLGSRLVGRVTDDHDEVTCHVRASNADALGFYLEHGFLVAGRDDGYYRDGTDAYRLVCDPTRDVGLADLL